jgi:diguanylate cyclase (GGDEF)-like protein
MHMRVSYLVRVIRSLSSPAQFPQVYAGILLSACLLTLLAYLLTGLSTPNITLPVVQGIDLTQQQWYARRGYSPLYDRGFNPSDAGVLAVSRFPIELNSLFKIPSGDGLNEFTLMAEFTLSPWAAGQAQMLSLAELGENWAVYLNGQEIHKEIYLNTSGEIIRRRSLQKTLISLPPSALHVGSNILVFRMLGSAPPNPYLYGLLPGFPNAYGYLIDSAEALIRQRDVQSAISWLKFGVYLFFGAYQIFLYRRRRETHALMFGLFLFTIGSYTAFNSPYAFETLPDTSLITRALFVTVTIAPSLMGFCLWDYLFSGKTLPLGLRWMAWISLAALCGMLLAPLPWAYTLMLTYLPFILFSILYFLLLLLRAYHQRVPDAAKLLAVGLLTLVLVIFSLADTLVFRTTLDISSWIPLILSIAFATILIDRFWKVSLELVNTNQLLAANRDRLEEEVIERTTELVAANQLLETQLLEINQLHESLTEQAVRDPLTHLFNRRHLMETLEREFTRADREGTQIGLVMLDIDHFKLINDTYGHKAGDLMLQALGSMLISQVRSSDFPCRYGGEEFLVVLPTATLDATLRRAEEWRSMVENMQVDFDGKKISVTISVGVAEYPVNATTPVDILAWADSALYDAKKAGRNCVSAAGQPAHRNLQPG